MVAGEADACGQLDHREFQRFICILLTLMSREWPTAESRTAITSAPASVHRAGKRATVFQLQRKFASPETAVMELGFRVLRKTKLRRRAILTMRVVAHDWF